MRKIKLNSKERREIGEDGFYLDANEKYVIDLSNELQEQMAIAQSVQVFNLKAMKDYHKWLLDNGFNVNMPNPTNEFVSRSYGVKPLWKTDRSQGVVVRNENDEDYYIVMECSRENKGFKHTQIIVTLGGCI